MIFDISYLTPQQKNIFNKASQGKEYLEQLKKRENLKISPENKAEHIINLTYYRMLNALIKDTPSKEFDGEYDDTFNNELDEQVFNLLLEILLTDGQNNLNQEQIMECYKPYRDSVFEEFIALGFIDVEIMTKD
jgi:hypothetical protein